jgi:hypothetical protein
MPPGKREELSSLDAAVTIPQSDFRTRDFGDTMASTGPVFLVNGGRYLLIESMVSERDASRGRP